MIFRIENEWHMRYILATIDSGFRFAGDLKTCGLSEAMNIDASLYSLKLKKLYNNIICVYLKNNKQFPIEVEL